MILVDTNVWIDFFAGAEPSSTAVEKLLNERRAALSVISVFELRAGIVGKKRLEQIDTLVAVLPAIPLTQDMAQRAGELYTRLKSKGKLVGNEDLFIAAAALDLGVPVLTANRRHFDRIPDLEVLDPSEIAE